MGKFQFKNYTRTLEFPGCEFTVECNSDLGDSIYATRSEYDALVEKYQRGEVDKAALVAFVKETTDKILGDGATDKIFAGRTITLTDASDVLVFIITEITETFRANKKAGAGTKRLPGTTILK